MATQAISAVQIGMEIMVLAASVGVEVDTEAVAKEIETYVMRAARDRQAPGRATITPELGPTRH